MKYFNDKNEYGANYSNNLWEKLKRLAASEDVSEDYTIPVEVIDLVMSKFYKEIELAAQEGDNDAAEQLKYWKDHAEVTGELMYQFAIMNNKNPELFRQMGILHDADYLKHSHYAQVTEEVHPAPLCDFLLENGVPATICLSIIEHAGYISKGSAYFNSTSAALSACDDLATFLSALKSPQVLARQGFSVDRESLSTFAIELSNTVSEESIPVYPENFYCSRRVLEFPDLFINQTFDTATKST